MEDIARSLAGLNPEQMAEELAQEMTSSPEFEQLVKDAAPLRSRGAYPA
jgi:hypothetical protein